MKNTRKESSKSRARAEAVCQELLALRSELISAPESLGPLLAEVHTNFQASARNLLHYLAMRRHDLRPLQSRLAEMGLSSLGRAESHVLGTVDALLSLLHHLLNRTWDPPADPVPAIEYAEGQQLLDEHTQTLLGPAPPGRNVRIMVTMPSEAANNYTLVHNLLQQGMDCMRINCAHDDATVWNQMILNLRRAELALERTCRIVMDLAGPKLRTGPMEPGPRVLKIQPERNSFGKVTAPARVWLTSEECPVPPPSEAAASLPVPGAWLAQLQIGEKVRFRDARNSTRRFRILDVTSEGCWAEAISTAYIVPGTRLKRCRTRNHGEPRKARVGNLPTTENAIRLFLGDRLIVTRDLAPGRPATLDCVGQTLSPARIGCTIPEVFEDVQTGETIWFDDGRIGGVIDQVEKHHVLVRITHARTNGEWLRADKGINLPESDLQLRALTAQDLKDLSFVAEHADVVELSFACTAQDVELLQNHLATLGSNQPAIVLKIETRRGFENLPAMLLAAMRGPCCGVMIARGDLAVESGFERLAEVQEEILWICEAAHVPVIWATQVLETLAKTGMPSRAEITDAAMGHRAECVMLNKGPHIVSAVRVLDDILRRMQNHQAKKKSMLRELRLAHALSDEFHAPPQSTHDADQATARQAERDEGHVKQILRDSQAETRQTDPLTPRHHSS